MHALTLYYLSPTLANHKHTQSCNIIGHLRTHTQLRNIIGHLCTHSSSHNTIGQCLLYNLSHTAVSLVLCAVDKGLRGRNVLQSLLLILLRICSRSVRPTPNCVVTKVKVLDFKHLTTFSTSLEMAAGSGLGKRAQTAWKQLPMETRPAMTEQKRLSASPSNRSQSGNCIACSFSPRDDDLISTGLILLTTFGS